MSQPYNATFARAYNRFWSAFARQHAPRIQAFYEATPIGRANRALLDVCCGTGNLAAHFLANGYTVTGIDLSAPQLDVARENCREHVERGAARFVQADASDFEAGAGYGLAVSTYDALNHLPGMPALAGCFRSVFRALAPGGWFIFDLNTRSGLRRWNNMHVYEMEDLVVIDRGVYDGASERAATLMTGFLRGADGRYERFEQLAYDTVYDLAQARAALLETGWEQAHFARGDDLAAPITEPEREERAFILARKPAEHPI
jgi:SAM-dependent methyltransferase